jgi:predicted dehydrogenase
MKSLRWAVIGVGRFGRIHARILDQLPGSELSVLVNRNPEKLAEAAAEFPDAATVADYAEVLENPEIDVVSITTHWKDHFFIAKAALEAGKHVFLEKPMAETREQCEELLRVAELAKGEFMVGHVCRFDPRVTAAKAAIEAGRIGRVVSMHAKRNLPKAPGNIRLDKISPLMGDGIHDADMMMWFLAESPTKIYARNVHFGGFEYPDLGWAMLSFGDDAIGVVETVWCLPEKVATTIDAKMEIIGTEGKIEIDCANTGVSIVESTGLESRPDTVYWPSQDGVIVGSLPREVAYFADCIRNGKASDVITPFEAARAVSVMEVAELSANEKRAISFSFKPSH